MDIKNIKLRYDIIGNDPRLELALNKAIQVAPTDLSILITGESGVGKDVFSRIIHENSLRKHVRQGRGLISVNCGAIPAEVISKKPVVAPSFSTRLVNCRWLCRLNCFAYWKTVRLSL